MPQTTLEVQYVNQVQPGRKHGSIKDTNGNIYGVPPTMLGIFQPGNVYEIFFEERSWQGKTYSTVKTAKPVNKMPQPQTAGSGPVKTFAAAQQERSTEIWVNSMMQRAIDKDKLDPWNEEACIEYGEIQKRVHRRLFVDEEGEPPDFADNGQKQAHPVGAQVTPQTGNSSMAPQMKTYAPRPASVTPASPAGQQQWSEEYGDQIPF